MPMRSITIRELQDVVKKTIDEERAVEALRCEIKRVLGPVVVVEGKIEQVIEVANDRLAVLEKTGRFYELNFKPSIVAKFMNHDNAEMRKFAAKTLPKKLVTRMALDKSSIVRAAVATRLPIDAVREMLKRFSTDDELRSIYKRRCLIESGLPSPAVDDGYLNMYDRERLGNAAQQDNESELSEQWYKEKASKFLQDYGNNIEYMWEEMLVRRYASSLRATSHVTIDETRLLQAIKDLIEEKEDRTMERLALKETIDWLHTKRSALDIVEENEDKVNDLINSGLTSQEYIEQANKIFKIKESTLPQAIRKYRLGEHNRRNVNMPVVGMLPHDHGFRAIDESALDKYCQRWNERQQLQGEPLQLSWSVHPDQFNKISFNVVLK